MRLQWFLRKREWGKNAPDNRDFFTTYILIGLIALSVVFACQS